MVSTVVWRILAFYIGSMTLIVSVVPWDSIKAGESPFAHALDHMQIPYAGSIMSAIVLTAVLSCLNSSFYVASRVLFVLAERGDAPRWLVATNRRHVPARSVLLAAAAGFAGVIAAILSPELVFGWLVKASGALIVFIYMTDRAVADPPASRARARRRARRRCCRCGCSRGSSYRGGRGHGRHADCDGHDPGPAQPAVGKLISVAVALVAYAVKRTRTAVDATAGRRRVTLVAEQVRVLVIGGGAVGCSCLYHLAAMGWTDAILLERDDLTSGSTWHAAGNCPTFSTNSSLLKLQQYSAALYRRLGDDTGYPINYHVTGSVRLAHTDGAHGRIPLRPWHGAGCNGLDYRMLTPQELRERHPLVELEDLKGALWDPCDGDIDPAQLTQALAAGARRVGSRVQRFTRVTGLARGASGDWQVSDYQGRLRAEVDRQRGRLSRRRGHGTARSRSCRS